MSRLFSDYCNDNLGDIILMMTHIKGNPIRHSPLKLKKKKKEV